MDIGPLPDNTPASFYLAYGLRSYAGGNLAAALDRLQRCKELLLATSNNTPAAAADEANALPAQLMLTSDRLGVPDADATSTVAEPSRPLTDLTPPTGTHIAEKAAARHNTGSRAQSSPSALACRLGAVCGCLGDCWRKLGSLHDAEKLYQESTSYLKPFAEDDAEVAHAMSVSINKLGDLRSAWHGCQGLTCWHAICTCVYGCNCGHEIACVFLWMFMHVGLL